MRTLLTVLLLVAAPLPVRPVGDAPRLVAEIGRGKPVLLHFWATWCAACREEFPRLRAKLVELDRRGVQVALISIDRPEDRAKAEEMLREYRLSTLRALLLDAPDPDPVARAVGDKKWDGTLPATFLYDARGKLRKSFIGATDPARLGAEVARLSRQVGN